MRLLGISILILLMMTQAFSHWFIKAFFQINRDYIVAELCENRYRPQLKCEGNCILMKKMKQTEEQEKSSPSSLKLEITSLFVGDEAFAKATLQPEFIIKSSLPRATDNGHPIDRSVAIFHPPGTDSYAI